MLLGLAAPAYCPRGTSALVGAAATKPGPTWGRLKLESGREGRFLSLPHRSILSGLVVSRDVVLADNSGRDCFEPTGGQLPPRTRGIRTKVLSLVTRADELLIF